MRFVAHLTSVEAAWSFFLRFFLLDDAFVCSLPVLLGLLLLFLLFLLSFLLAIDSLFLFF